MLVVMLLISSQVNSSSPVGREGQDCEGTWVDQAPMRSLPARLAAASNRVVLPRADDTSTQGHEAGHNMGQADRSSTAGSSQSYECGPPGRRGRGPYTLRSDLSAAPGGSVMPRAVWSGAISFGLVSIPVKLFTAVSSKTVRFNQIDRRTGSRVRQRLVSEADGSEVDRADIAKGYQIRPGDYVLVDDDELEALDPKAEHTIEIEEFVDLAELDPLYFDRPYWLAPDPSTVKPYALLAQTMADRQQVAIARFVMRSRQQLAAIRSVDGRLVMSTMNW
ncbi:MAG TPA: Ku protein, partial [Enhygromyxa sp.]|nr:Ku protein [Enhygromyxa sp.]